MDQSDLTLCAFRYCMGRMSYIVSEMCAHLREHWNEIRPEFQHIIESEIQEAIDKNCCGMDMDCEAWLSLLKWIQNRQEHLINHHNSHRRLKQNKSPQDGL